MLATVRVSKEQLKKLEMKDWDTILTYPNKAPGAWMVVAGIEHDTGDMIIHVRGDTLPVQGWLDVIMPLTQL